MNELLLKRLKKRLKVEKDKELAEIFNVSTFIFSRWKKSRYKLLYESVKYGLENKIDFNSLFYDLGETEKSVSDYVRVIHADDLFSYYLNPDDEMAFERKNTISFLENATIGFQIISQNMEPCIAVSSYVFGKPIALSQLEINNVYILNVKNRGICVVRFSGESNGSYNFENDNRKFEPCTYSQKNIIEVFLVESTFKRY